MKQKMKNKLKKLRKIVRTCLIVEGDLQKRMIEEKAIKAILKLFIENLCDDCGCNVGVVKVSKECKLCYYCRNNMHESCL